MKKEDLTVPAIFAEAIGMILGIVYIGLQIYYGTVSYTHLDVYKRQDQDYVVQWKESYCRCQLHPVCSENVVRGYILTLLDICLLYTSRCV